MTDFPYTTGIPAGPHNPSADQPIMQQNNDSINSILGVDHFTFNDSNGGWHQQSTYVVTGTPPATNSNQLALFNTTGLELHMIRAGDPATETSLTTSKIGVPIAGPTGVTYLPGPSIANKGGMLIQWGFVNGTHSGGFFSGGDSGVVAFTPAFPNFCFNVWTQPCFSGTIPLSQATVAIQNSSISTAGFTWAMVTNSGGYNKFFWIAIGQ